MLTADPNLLDCVQQLAGGASGMHSEDCAPLRTVGQLPSQLEVLLLSPQGKVLFSGQHRQWRGLNLMDAAQSSPRLARQLRQLHDLPVDGTSFIPYGHFAPAHEYAAFWLAPLLRQGKLQGFLLLRVSDEDVRGMTDDYAGLGEDGENLLVSLQENGDALVIAPLRHTPHAAFRLKIDRARQAGQEMWQSLEGGMGAGSGQDYRGRQVLAAWAAVPVLGGAIMVTRDEAAVMAPLVQQRNQLLVLLLLVSAAAGVVAFSRARRLVVPVSRLMEASLRISRGEPEVRLPALEGEEFAVLGRTFNAMAEQIERNQQQRQSQLEDAERMARLGYCIANSDGRPDEWTVQLYHILEYPTNQPPQIADLLQRIHPEDLPRVLLAHAANIKDGYEVEYRLLLPDARIKYLREVGRHEFDSNGLPLRRVAVIQDVTAARQMLLEMHAAREALAVERLARAEEAISHAEAKAQAILQAMSDGVFGLATDGRVVFCNAAAGSLLGDSQAGLVGRPLDDILQQYNAYGQHLGEPLPLLGALRQGKPCNSHQEQFGSPQRSMFPVFYQLNMLHNPIGELAAVLLFRDISQQRANEVRLEQMSRAVTQSPAGVMITNTQGIIEFVNPRLLQMTGYREDELLGQLPSMLKSGKAASALYTELWRTLLAGESWKGELLNRRKDGREYWVMQMISPIWDSNGQLTHYISVQEDITAQKQMAEHLQEAVAAAESATAAKSAFLANMSHEIRTPMNAIIGLSDLAMREQLPARAHDYLGKVVRSARGLLEIINDILDFSKIESGKLSVEQVPFVLEDVLESLADVLAMRLDGKPLELVFDIDAGVPGHWRGDPLRLGQVLLNLLGNAVKFTASGFVVLTVRWRDARLHFDVRDSGIGMSAEQLERLFRPFSQADVSTQRRYGGSGLGLVISNQLVRLMGGDGLQAASQTGAGSSFSFSLPLQALPAPAVAGWRPAGRLFHARLSELCRSWLLPCSQTMGIDTLQVDSRSQLHALLQDWNPQDVLLLDSDAADWRELVDNLPWPATAKLILLSRHHVSSAELLALSSCSLPVSEVWLKPLTLGRLSRALQRLAAEDVTPDGKLGAALPRLDGCLVLVVDDVALNQEVAAAYLQEAGALVSFAANGEEALQLLAQGLPDVVLMDCHMPVMDGFAATRAIRANPAWQGLKVIALTANALTGSREEALEAGMDDYISKPLDPQQLFAVLQRAGLQPREPAPAAPAAVGKASQDATVDVWQQLRQAGVNVEDGIARAVERPDIYRKWLLMFARNCADFREQTDAALAAGDATLLHRLVHTVKGAAANVSADVVVSHALALEAVLHGGQGQQEQAAALAQLQQVLDTVQQAVLTLERE
ncbi:PAS domain-containing protein [Vogesella amnigena]|uniref:histidine kinase n=1 Tax=Vogesella amnigena TaxID=1507449 RepID=A0ABV7TRR3_9NEIS